MAKIHLLGRDIRETTSKCRRPHISATAANMSKVPDVERVSVAAYGRIIASFKGGVRIDLEAP